MPGIKFILSRAEFFLWVRGMGFQWPVSFGILESRGWMCFGVICAQCLILQLTQVSGWSFSFVVSLWTWDNSLAHFPSGHANDKKKKKIKMLVIFSQGRDVNEIFQFWPTWKYSHFKTGKIRGRRWDASVKGPGHDTSISCLLGNAFYFLKPFSHSVSSMASKSPLMWGILGLIFQMWKWRLTEGKWFNQGHVASERCRSTGGFCSCCQPVTLQGFGVLTVKSFQ